MHRICWKHPLTWSIKLGLSVISDCPSEYSPHARNNSHEFLSCRNAAPPMEALQPWWSLRCFLQPEEKGESGGWRHLMNVVIQIAVSHIFWAFITKNLQRTRRRITRTWHKRGFKMIVTLLRSFTAEVLCLAFSRAFRRKLEGLFFRKDFLWPRILQTAAGGRSFPRVSSLPPWRVASPDGSRSVLFVPRPRLLPWLIQAWGECRQLPSEGGRDSHLLGYSN